jgi:hypothetical protein
MASSSAGINIAALALALPNNEIKRHLKAAKISAYERQRREKQMQRKSHGGEIIAALKRRAQRLSISKAWRHAQQMKTVEENGC